MFLLYILHHPVKNNSNNFTVVLLKSDHLNFPSLYFHKTFKTFPYNLSPEFSLSYLKRKFLKNTSVIGTLKSLLICFGVFLNVNEHSQLAFAFCIYLGVFLKPPTTYPPTTDQPTHQPRTHRPTNRLLSTYIKIEDQILNMFYIL